MGTVNETMRSVNTTLRTLLMTGVVAGAGYGGYLAYDMYHEPRQRLADKQAELDQALASLETSEKKLAETSEQLERTKVAMQLLKVRRRLARLKCLEQKTNADGKLISKVEFVEVNDEGQPMGAAKQFEVEGDLVYVDSLTVTFDDKYVEQSDLDRSTAIVLFQRIFGEHQEPVTGERVDEVRTRPTAYARGTPMSEFEKKIWDDFWQIANNPTRSGELGIYAAHGKAPSMRVQPGKTYELELRSTGEMTFRTLE
jgi:hypothetical protein